MTSSIQAAQELAVVLGTDFCNTTEASSPESWPEPWMGHQGTCALALALLRHPGASLFPSLGLGLPICTKGSLLYISAWKAVTFKPLQQ